MTEASPITTIQNISLSMLVPSQTEAQTQRRKHFDKVSLQQLAESIKGSGIVNPILVRPREKGFEIVAGERRFQAAKLAGLESVPVSVRDLDDGQVLELQLIENLQREGLHELHEAEGYEQLRKRGLSAIDIAKKVGRSKEYVFGRMKLLALCSAGREAFYEGKLNASVALLVARIPNEKLQKEALKELTRWEHSYRAASDMIQRNYMLRLSEAPFDTNDAALVRGCTACSACPKNTLSQPGLFGDVKGPSAGVCTDPPCFQAKVTAHGEAIVAKAKASGIKVISGEAAKKLLPYSHHRHLGHNGPYVMPNDTHPQDMKSRTYGELAGKDVKHALLISPHTGEAIKVLAREDVKAAIKAKGLKLRPTPSKSSSSSSRSSTKADAEARAQEDKERKQQELLVAIGKAIHAKAPKPITRDELQRLAEAVSNYYSLGEVMSDITGSDEDPNFDKLNEAGLIRYIRAAFVAGHIEDGDKGLVLDEAKRHGVDVKKIEAELAAPPAEKKPATAKPKKAAKKK